MKFALPGALALACLTAIPLAGCGAAVQAQLGAIAPALETVGCDAIENTAPAQTLCIGLAGDIVTLGQNIAAKLAASKATALVLPASATTVGAPARHGK